jgi:hypothetical protein
MKLKVAQTNIQVILHNRGNIKMKMIFKLATAIATGAIVTFSTGVFAADWEYAIDEIMAGNFGTSAGFQLTSEIVIDQERLEYADFDENGNPLVCKDFEVSVDKERVANKSGKGKFQSITDTDIVTYCQPDANPI